MSTLKFRSLVEMC